MGFVRKVGYLKIHYGWCYIWCSHACWLQFMLDYSYSLFSHLACHIYILLYTKDLIKGFV